MIQDQLVDYVSSQMKLGVSRDAIKSALVSAGWVAGDVEDTIKKTEENKSKPMGGQTASAPVTMATGSAGADMKKAAPQTIRVSDLVSSPTSPASSSAQLSTSTTSSSANAFLGGATKTPAKIDPASFGGKISGNSFQATPLGGAPKKSNGTLVMEIVGGVAILLLAGLSWYFYAQGAGLSAKVSSLTSQSAAVTAKLTTMQAQVDASSTGFAAQIASLTAANNDLALNLAFYAAPNASSTSATPATINGVLGGGVKAAYFFTTPYGAKIFVANSANASTSAEFKPLIGQTVSFTGTYIPGSDEMTVTSASTSTVASQ